MHSAFALRVAAVIAPCRTERLVCGRVLFVAVMMIVLVIADGHHVWHTCGDWLDLGLPHLPREAARPSIGQIPKMDDHPRFTVCPVSLRHHTLQALICDLWTKQCLGLIVPSDV